MSGTVVVPARFLELFQSQDASMIKTWATAVGHFFLDVGLEKKDFRQTRLERLVGHLKELLIFLTKVTADA
jgi:hypothetical protein